MQRILIALDKSELSEVVFEQGVALAEAMGAQMLLLNVTSLFEGMAVGTDMQDLALFMKETSELHRLGIELLKSFADRTSDAVREYAERAPEAEVDVEYSHRFGEPGKTICEMAQEWEADTIVIGRRGIGALGELFMGSVSNYVLHHAPCSVVVINNSPVSSAQTAAEESEVSA